MYRAAELTRVDYSAFVEPGWQHVRDNRRGRVITPANVEVDLYGADVVEGLAGGYVKGAIGVEADRSSRQILAGSQGDQKD